MLKAVAEQPKEDESSWEKSLHLFFTSPLAEKAGSFLSERARIALHVDKTHTYLFQRRKGRNVMEKVNDPRADVHFFVPLVTMRHLLDVGSLPGSGIGTMGVAVIEHLFHADAEKKIRFRVDTTFVVLWAKGYFSVLKAGGPEVASYLARWGYDSVARLKDLLHQIRG